MVRLSVFIAITLLSFSCSEHKVVQKAVQDESPRIVGPITVKAEEMRQLNPHGALFEIERDTDSTIPKVGSVATFHCVARNFVQDQMVLLVRETLTGSKTVIYEYRVDDDGTLGRQFLDGTMVLENDALVMFDFFRGEPVRYWLITRDGKTRIGRQIVPYPIRTKGRDGAEISVRRLTADARLAFCEGEGFLPDEVVYVTSRSGKQLVANVAYVCANGKFSMILEPAAVGSSGGVALLEVRRAHERLTLEYDWGCEALSPKKRLASSLHMDHDALAKLAEESTS